MVDISFGDMMLAAGLVFGVATACQVIAPMLRIPGLILLLPAGFILGLVAPQLQADIILGPAFPVAVDLMVAVILFQGGMALGDIQLRGHDKRVVRRLVWIGGPLTWMGGALATHFILGLAWPLAFLLGAILVVSGPTVVTPILDFVRPKPRVRGILMWEGTMLDPIGAILAVVVFQLVRVSTMSNSIESLVTLVATFAVAFLVAFAGLFVAILASKLTRGNAMLGTQALIGSVLLSVGIANYITQSSGLLTALLMGIGARRLAKRLNTTLDPITPFFDTVASIGVGVLFVSITALVPSPVLVTVVLPAVAVALVLMLVMRPLVALLCTRKADLTLKERAFIGWMDPRGIVAAATASSLGAALLAVNVPGAEFLLPSAFVIIAVTVFVYGLSAVPVASVLGVRETAPTTTGRV